MSNAPQGPGWWRANDGQWYPPEQASGAVQTIPRPQPAGADHALGPGWWQAADGRWYPPQPGVPGAVSGKKPLHRRIWFWVLVIVALGFGGCVAVGSALGIAVDHVAHEKHTIVYSVTGTAPVTSLSYVTLQEGHGQNGAVTLPAVPLPWSRTVVASGLITVYHLQVTTGPAGGSATCTITDNGSLVASHTVTGPQQSLSCTWGG